MSAPRTRADLPDDGFFDSFAQLTSFVPGDAAAIESLSDEERDGFFAELARVQTTTYRWMQQGPFLEALTQPDTQVKLQQAAARVGGWSRQLEEFSKGARLRSQRDWEFVNQLIVGGKDIAWQLEKDLLQNLSTVFSVLGEDASAIDRLPRHALSHAWQLHLFLSSLNRLEVRGRDSAGIAVYLRFPQAATLDNFLDSPGFAPLREEFRCRQELPTLTHGAVVRPATSGATLLLIFKVAREVGKMGDNVAFLRQAMASDPIFQAALRHPEVEVQTLAHTRWASNGVISLPNAHPVDSSVLRQSADGSWKEEDRGDILAVLNGDIDNYQELKERYVDAKGSALDETVTTDAKIIPIVVGHHYRQTQDLSHALRLAMDEFEGSMAISVMAADRPGEAACGQKGSGQGLFLGQTETAVAIASEMYGVVEFTPRYIKAEGEAKEGGEVFRLRRTDETVATVLIEAGPDGLREFELPESRVRTAEITTRDINRGDKPHFFLKEIGESVESTRKTMRGKFEVSDGKARMLTSADVVAPELLEALQSEKVRQIIVIGQGTAAVAAEGVAHLLRVALEGAKTPFRIASQKATELSGHHLSADMSDCLLIPVSQSGTTTDTNRTVDLARARGAWVIGIVNRRNSDLVYKSQGVLYTSDGRDIEMSVASTKAFYSQNVAGQILALTLGSALGTLSPERLLREVEKLEQLPKAMEKVLTLEPQVRDLARKFALKRRYWAIAGSGAAKIAANEIRIKLSELCYKSIAVDFLEDKKHIDLSSEPLILACVSGIPSDTVADAAKEIAIFKAHNSVPLVIADEGESRFDRYAAGTIKVPSTGGPLDYLLATMVGHLFGYHAAATFDHYAERLRKLRASLLDSASDDGSLNEGLPTETVEQVVDLEDVLLEGELEGALKVSTGAKLATVFNFLLGRIALDEFSRRHTDPFQGALATLSDAIAELSRPIDAIKHQAKTVTVGISRIDQGAQKGVLWRTFNSFRLPVDELAETHRRFLTFFEPLVAEVSGATLYGIEGLDPLGRPTDQSIIRTLRKEGCARDIVSRSDEMPKALAGTKWAAVKRREIYLGRGQMDTRKILIVPVVGGATEGKLLLYHLDVIASGSTEQRLQALQALENRFEALHVAITEGNVTWQPSVLEVVDNETLFFAHRAKLAATILERLAQNQP